MLANSSWQIQIGVCVNDITTRLQSIGEKLAIETSSIFSQQFGNMLLCRSHTPISDCQHEHSVDAIHFIRQYCFRMGERSRLP